MAEKLNPKVVALSLAGVSGIVYAVCAALFAIAPRATISAYADMFHGVDLRQIARTAVPLGSTIAGFVEIIISSLVVGWLFTAFYNYMLTTTEVKAEAESKSVA